MSRQDIEMLLRSAARQMAVGQPAGAEAICRQALQKNADHDAAWDLLGLALLRSGRVAEAVEAFHKAVDLRRSSALYRLHLGNAYRTVGELQKAEQAYQKAIELQPSLAAAHSGLGVVLAKQGRHDQAIALFQAALTKDPRDVDALLNLAPALAAKNRLTEAIEHGRRMLELFPDNSLVKQNLASALSTMGRVDEAIGLLRQAVAAARSWDGTQSQLLFLLAQVTEDPRKLFDEHVRLVGRFFANIQPQPYGNDADPDRKLKIAYMSADFRTHPVAYFLEPILANHDRRLFEIYCYSDTQIPDAVTLRMRGYADQWRQIAGLKTEQVVGMIRSDAIDILVDLAVHSTAASRIPVLAHKPAPVQVSYLGYAWTTGLCAVDWRITDAHIDPPGQSDLFSAERLMRLPQTQWVYQAPEVSPPINALPAVGRGFVTFGSVNKRQKITPQTVQMWAAVLRATPNSRMHIMAGGLGDPTAQTLLRQTLAQQGVEPERLILSGPVGLAQYMQYFHEVDIILDTYPCAGGTNTCHALWMGVPVVTRIGHTSLSRVGLSVLANVGLNDLVADSAEAFVRIAAELAGDLNRLSSLRAGLRRRMQQSPLCDAAGFTRNLEAAYQQMWRQWCSTRQTDLPQQNPCGSRQDASG